MILLSINKFLRICLFIYSNMTNKDKNNESSEITLNKSEDNSLLSQKFENLLNTFYSVINQHNHTNRKNNSLDILTKKFILYVYQQKTDIINLKRLSEKTKVHKRRVYDITNVLEGMNNIFN